MEIIRPKYLVTVDVFYYIPDHPLLLQEFLWQTNDEWPSIPRVHRFLNYWHYNIDATINEVFVQCSEGKWKYIEYEYKL